MPENLSRREQVRGTSRVMIAGACVAALLFIAGIAWVALPKVFNVSDYVGRPLSGADSNAPTTGVGTGVPTQREAQSAVGKNDPAGQEDKSGGRARQIKQSTEALSLSDQQRQQLRGIIAQQRNAPRLDRSNFELMIGSSVPQQTNLADLPAEATQALNGYWGDQYVMVGDTMVVVDQHTRRVVAIVSGMT